MNKKEPTVRRATVPNVILAVLPYLTLLGFVGIVVTIVLGFEEPHQGMLFVSALFLVAAPLGMALHLAFTDELSHEEKRAWIAGLTKFKDPGLFGAYFTSTLRRQATERLRENAKPVESGDQ